jgi:hypothetical protein
MIFFPILRVSSTFTLLHGVFLLSAASSSALENPDKDLDPQQSSIERPYDFGQNSRAAGAIFHNGFEEGDTSVWGSIGSITPVYRQGGVWLTPAEIQQIPTNNDSWDDLVSYSTRPMDIVGDIFCTSGGSCSGDSDTTAAMFARAIVGLRLNDQALLNELRGELNRVPQAINHAIDVREDLDEKWAERNIALIAVSANLIDHRPPALISAFWKALRGTNFEEGHTIEWHGLNQLPNKPAHGLWSLLAVAYLAEDWPTVNAAVKAHAKAMGEKNWGGLPNDHRFVLTGQGEGDDWQTLRPGGKSDPIAVMPEGIYYGSHGVGGLYLADQYRAGDGPEWPPSHTNYTWEGLGPHNALAWAAHHIGYTDVFALGNYAILRSAVFSYAAYDGKSVWAATGNDTWQIAAIMAWAKPIFGRSLPAWLKPEPGAQVEWPLPVETGGSPGRGMGFMFATHYARLVD